MRRSLLFVELGTKTARELRRGFAAEGFKVDTASGAVHAQNMAAMRGYSGVILFANSSDLLTPCTRALARALTSGLIPLLGVANISEREQIEFFEGGGAYCLPAAAPFGEMLAQLRALFDVAEGFPVHYRISDLGIDPVARRASRAGRPLSLRPMEFDLLVYLAERSDQAVSWQELHCAFWSRRDFSSRRIAVQMHNLRRAIDVKRQASLLHTLRNDGYMLSARLTHVLRAPSPSDLAGEQLCAAS